MTFGNEMIGSKEGFTLLEMTTVLAVVAVLAAVAIPNVASQIPRYRLQAAARQVMGDLLFARMQAVSEQNEVRVLFPSGHEYTILDDDDNDGAFDPGERIRSRNIQITYPDVDLAVSANLTFYPRGTASPATVTVTNRSGIKEVKIHLTGRVKID